MGFEIALTASGFVFGILMIVLPTRVILRHDRMTGYHIYRKTLESSGNEDKAIEEAGAFYKFFGLLFMIGALVFLILSVPAASGEQPDEQQLLLQRTDKILEELASLPEGIVVTHDPNPVYARLDSTSRWNYKWVYKTTVKARSGIITVREFGSLFWDGQRWVFGNYTGALFTRKDFAEWYSCPDARLTVDSEFSDPSNWSRAGCLRDGKARWFYIGTDAKGNRVKGEAVLDEVGKLQE